MKGNNYAFLFIIIFFKLSYYNTQEIEECPKEKPNRRNNENEQCELISCSDENIENGVCTIENEIVKIQWLNNIIISKELDIYSFAIISYNKDIIFYHILK